MKRKLIPLLGLAGLAVSGGFVHAQQFNYSDGDLILDFSESGYSDVEVDIGSLGNLDLLAGENNGTVALNGLDYNLTTQLIGNFGATLTNVSFSVFGLQNSASTVYLTQAQSGASPNSNPRDLTAGSQQDLVGTVQAIVGVGADTVGILPWSKNNSANAINNTANVAIIPNSGSAAVNSYTTIGPAGWDTAAVTPQNTTPQDVFTTGDSITSDLFEYDNVGKGPNNNPNYTEYQGEFTFNGDGSLDFTPVPEPKTYGLLAAGGALFFTLRNRFRQKQA